MSTTQKALELSSKNLLATAGHQFSNRLGGSKKRCGGPALCRICATQRAVIDHVAEHGITPGMRLEISLSGVTTQVTWQDVQDIMVAMIYSARTERPN